MADNQPTNVPAVDDTNPADDVSQQPVTSNVADNTVPTNTDSGAEQIKVDPQEVDVLGKYFKSQGIEIGSETLDDKKLTELVKNLSQDDLIKLARHNISLKKAVSKTANEVKYNPTVDIPNVVNSSNSSQVEPPVQNNDTQQGSIQMRDVLLLRGAIKEAYPDLSEQVSDNSLFNEAISSGVNLYKANGDIDLESILKYAGQKNEVVSLRKKVEELEKAKSEYAPSLDASQQMMQDMSSKMDANLASILIYKPNHPRYDEAKNFFKNNTQ